MNNINTNTKSNQDKAGNFALGTTPVIFDNCEFIDVKALSRRARQDGVSSQADSAFFEFITRLRSAEMPGCVILKNKRDEKFVVFDLREPPDFLPIGMRMECLLAAAMVAERRKLEMAPQEEKTMAARETPSTFAL